jgi:hypothetical protein
MTAQIPENLLLDGETLALCSEPLGDYFDFSGEQPRFADHCTALWRGYVGTWEIRDDRLYLLAIDAQYQDGSPARLADLFPGHPDRVFAHWFTGTLRCPRGGQVEYVHMGYGSIFEEDLLLHIDRGVLTRREVRINGKAEANAPQGYGPAAFTIFPLTPASSESEKE